MLSHNSSDILDVVYNEKLISETLVELIKTTVSTVPNDVLNKIIEAQKNETNDVASKQLEIILKNIEKSKANQQTVCSGTGMLFFQIVHPPGFHQAPLTNLIHDAIRYCVKVGLLRQNSVEALSGKNTGDNLGEGHPEISYIESDIKNISIQLMLKVGGPDNLSPQYSLPLELFDAGRDLDGVYKVVLNTILEAQGKGCGPGILGICIGGDRPGGYVRANQQFWRKMDDINPTPELATLESKIVTSANKLGIGPMGLGGKTTLLACKIGTLNRLPASYYVTVRYMCWTCRRQGIILNDDGGIKSWIYT